MQKILLFTALLVILSTVACAGMTLEDYAAECGDWNDDYGDLYGASLSSSTSLSDLEDSLEDWNALSPPGEVEALHDIRVRGFKLFLETAEDNQALEERLDDLLDELDDASRSQRGDIRDEMDDLGDEQEDLFDDLRDELDDLNDEYLDELDDLPRRVERELEDGGCI